jgi:hypothetical protein
MTQPRAAEDVVTADCQWARKACPVRALPTVQLGLREADKLMISLAAMVAKDMLAGD